MPELILAYALHEQPGCLTGICVLQFCGLQQGVSNILLFHSTRKAGD